MQQEKFLLDLVKRPSIKNSFKITVQFCHATH